MAKSFSSGSPEVNGRRWRSPALDGKRRLCYGLDWLAAYREHPLDTIHTVGIINLPAFILGVPLETLAGFIAFRGVWAVYIHSNVRLPLGPLRMVIGSPELHHWHHDRDRAAGNYANLSPLMDVLLGTYRCPDHEPARFGINEPTPRSYLGWMIYPLLPFFPSRARSESSSAVSGPSAVDCIHSSAPPSPQASLRACAGHE